MRMYLSILIGFITSEIRHFFVALCHWLRDTLNHESMVYKKSAGQAYTGPSPKPCVKERTLPC